MSRLLVVCQPLSEEVVEYHEQEDRRGPRFPRVYFCGERSVGVGDGDKTVNRIVREGGNQGLHLPGGN